MCRALILPVFIQNGLIGFVQKSSKNITGFVFRKISLKRNNGIPVKIYVVTMPKNNK